MLKAIKYLMLILCVCALSACTGGRQEAQEQYVEEFVEHFREHDFAAMYAMTNDSMAYFQDLYMPDNEYNKRIFDAMSENLYFEITSSEKKNDTINVYAKVSNIDMRQAIPQIRDKYLQLLSTAGEDADVNAMYTDVIEEVLSSSDLAYTEKETVFNFVKMNGNWVIDSNIGIYDDLSGGYLQNYFDMNIVGGAIAKAQQNNEEK